MILPRRSKNSSIYKIGILLISSIFLLSFNKKIKPKGETANNFESLQIAGEFNTIESMKKDTVVEKIRREISDSVSISPSLTAKSFDSTLPTFPGGVNAFRNLVNMNFDVAGLKGEEGIFTTTISIDIGEDGKMNTITAAGENKKFNQAAIRSVKSIKKQLWQPATENGKPVKYLFTMPLTIELEKPLINN